MALRVRSGGKKGDNPSAHYLNCDMRIGIRLRSDTLRHSPKNADYFALLKVPKRDIFYVKHGQTSRGTQRPNSARPGSAQHRRRIQLENNRRGELTHKNMVIRSQTEVQATEQRSLRECIH